MVESCQLQIARLRTLRDKLDRKLIPMRLTFVKRFVPPMKSSLLDALILAEPARASTAACCKKTERSR